MALCTLHPGGLEMTMELVKHCEFKSGSNLLDAGCGQGATVAMLKSIGHNARGVDLIEPVVAGCLKADACNMPFPTGSMDGVLFECSLSRIDRWKQALEEAARILRPGGLLAVSDVIARGVPTSCNGLLGALRPWPEIESAIAAVGFLPQWQADHSDSIRNYWAQLVFEEGSLSAQDRLGGDPGALKLAKPGYMLAIFQKGDAKDGSLLRAWTKDRIGYKIQGSDNQMRWQLEQLGERIEEARADSPFFSQHLGKVDVSNLKSLKALESVPTMDGTLLAREGMSLLTVSQSEVERVRSFYTSGSTGMPKRFWFTADDLERTVDFFSAGMQHMASPGDQVAILMSDAAPDSIADLLSRGLARFGARGIPGGSLTLGEAADLLSYSQTVVGLPAQVFYLSRKHPELRPKAVLLSADYIPPSLSEAISSAWNCPVFSHYGLTETCYGLAVQCPARDSQHLRSSDFLVEILDPLTGKQVPPENSGEIVLSSLRPRAIPLIRYRTGDIASLKTSCVCGDHLPGLGRVLGRWSSLKEPLNIHALDDVMYSLPGLHGYQARYIEGKLFLLVEGPVDEAEILQRLKIPFHLERGKAVSQHSAKRLIMR